MLYSEDASALYEALSSLESRGWSADGSSRPADAQLHFHNFVNNADVVPRLLGSSLDSVHDRIQQYVASMQVSDVYCCCAFVQHAEARYRMR